MRKYVDTIELQDRLFKKLNNGNSFEEALLRFVCEVIDETPAANVVEHKPPEKWKQKGYGVFICSKCGGGATHSYCYCPNCGANMCKEDNEQ